MITISTAPQRGVFAAFALLLISMMLSAQALALAFDDGGFSYVVIDGTTNVAVTGRASGNTATDIVIPDTAVDGTTRYSVTSIENLAFEYNALTSVIIPNSETSSLGKLFNPHKNYGCFHIPNFLAALKPIERLTGDSDSLTSSSALDFSNSSNFENRPRELALIREYSLGRFSALL